MGRKRIGGYGKGRRGKKRDKTREGIGKWERERERKMALSQLKLLLSLNLPVHCAMCCLCTVPSSDPAERHG